MQAIPGGRVAWYVTGRFYVTESGSILDGGYFLHLDPVEGDLFSGAPGETTAYFTFLSKPFRACNVQNGDLTIGLDAVGEFSIYLADEPRGNFEDPESFACGEPIATFRRVSVVAGVTVPNAVAMNVFSAALAESRPFAFRGRTYDLGAALPHGITQWGTASTVAVDPPPAGYAKAVPFVGSAIAAG